MPSRSIRGQFAATQVLATTTVTNTTDVFSDWLDLKGYDAACFMLSIGAIADPAAIFTVRFQHDDDAVHTTPADYQTATDNPWTDPRTGEVLFGSIEITAADANTVLPLDYLLGKRYARLWINPQVNTAAADFSVLALQGYPHIRRP